jgi:hypothetical protein
VRPVKAGYIPMLLSETGHHALLHGLPGGGGTLHSDHLLAELTTAYITTMYYSALANQYLQAALPDNSAEVDEAMPRLRIAVERSYNDFTLAANWLKANGAKYIDQSPAKQFYDEVQGLEKDSIKGVAAFYAQKQKAQKNNGT